VSESEKTEKRLSESPSRVDAGTTSKHCLQSLSFLPSSTLQTFHLQRYLPDTASPRLCYLCPYLQRYLQVTTLHQSPSSVPHSRDTPRRSDSQTFATLFASPDISPSRGEPQLSAQLSTTSRAICHIQRAADFPTPVRSCRDISKSHTEPRSFLYSSAHPGTSSRHSEPQNLLRCLR
jgi:hypothetical protein